MDDKTRFIKYSDYKLIDLLNEFEKDEKNDQLQSDVETFLNAFPANFTQIPQLREAFNEVPLDHTTMSGDILQIIQQFIVKHTTALGQTPTGLQHVSWGGIVSVCCIYIVYSVTAVILYSIILHISHYIHI